MAALFVSTQIIAPLSFVAKASAAGAANIDQCANGTVASPTTCGTSWQNGDLNSSNSHYREGDSVPFRVTFSGLSTSGSHTFTFSWQTTKSGTHAYDYITTFNRTEGATDPCNGVSGCGSPTTFPIPTDSNVTAGGVTQIPGVFTLYNGTITAASSYSLSGTYAGDSTTSITVTFTAANATPVLAWGGHIASQIDWGAGNGAGSISGSPYHMATVSLDGGSSGSQDRALKASAVLPTPTITTQTSSPTVNVGSTVTDTASLSGPNSPLKGSVLFFICGPSGSAPNCTTGGTQVGVAKTVSPGSGSSGTATSDPYSVTTAGTYCFRAEYTPTSDSPYSPFDHTNQSTTAPNNECFVASIPSSTITIIKDAQPNSSQVFNYTTSGGLSTDQTGFTLTDTGSGTSNTKAFSGVAPGTYTITESATSGWDFKNLNCGAATNVQINGTTVTITITGGQSVICTYTNAQRGTVTVHKVTNPANDPTGFSITASTSNGNIAGNANRTVSTSSDVTYDVSQGTYNVSEDLSGTPGWSQASNTCSNLVVSASNLNVTCTITNTKLAKLKIVKATDPSSSNQPFSFSATGPSVTQGNASFVLDTNNNDSTYPNNFQYTNLAPGTYTVTETEPSGWQLTNLVCTGITYTWDGTTQTLSLTVPAGADITCTYTNTQLVSISGFKYEVNSDSSIVGPKAGWTIFLLKNNQVVGQTTTDGSGSYSFVNLLPGMYSLSEQLQNGWTQIFSPSSVSLTAGNTSTGNNFGNFQNATISGSKFNDLNGNGVWDNGEPALSGWTITLYDNGGSGALLTHQVAQAVTDGSGNYSFSNLPPTMYRLCETAQTGWSQTFPSTNGGCQIVNVTLSGHNYTHTDFGNQGRGTVTVIKNVDTDGNGTVDQTDVTNWNWNLDGSGNFTTGSGNPQNTTAGTHTVSEVQKTNFHVTASSCTGETTPSQPTTSLGITVSPGENVVCTFTNTRDTGSVNLIKHVVNDNGGTAVASNFTLHLQQNGVDVAGSPAPGSETGTLYTEPTGTYTVSENTPLAGYQQTTIVCDGVLTNSVTITSNTTKTCTITNDDIAPQLKVIKHVINDNSGTSQASDFTMQVTGTNVSNPSFPGSETGTTVNVNAGSYSVDEGDHTGYTETKSSDCSGTIALGETKTCTITNDDIAHPNIHVVKTGPATAHEGDTVIYTFTVTNTGDTDLSGVTVNDNIAGTATYISGDTNHDGILQKSETWIFQASYVIPTPQIADVVNTVTACANDPAHTQVCDTDNHDLDVLHPSIFVTKNGPAYGYEGQLIGYTFVVTNTGDTTLNNVYIDDDIANLEHCDANTLAPGASTNCTASFLIPTPQIADVHNVVTAFGTDSLGETVTAQADHTLDVLHPGIHVVKSGPAVAHPGDTVTYTFTVTNTGDIALSKLTVDDNIAGAGVYQSGDTNANGKLDLNETWIYTKQYTIPLNQVADVVNTVTACGQDPIQASLDHPTPTCATDEHHLDVLHPGIHVVKSGPANAYQGDTVTYSFTVTNTGDTPLSGLTVSDNIAGNGVYQSGDTNGNDELDLGETWIYTAVYTVPTTSATTITNTVTACGSDELQLQVCDSDDHSLHVFHPTITVNKVVVTTQEGDDGLFNLQIDGQTAGTGGNVGNGGTTGAIGVTPGSHSVGETAGDDTDLSDYVQTMSESCGHGTVNISGDQHIVCTITNTRKGSITIVKDAQPDSDQSFTFTGNLTGDDSSNFQLTDDGTNDGLNHRTFNDLAPGTYNVTESNVAHWDLSSIRCNTDQNVNVNNRNVVIHLQPGQNVVCTFVNQKRATIVVTKFNDYNLDGVFEPNGDPAEPALPGWAIVLDQNNQTTGSDGTTTFTDVKPGSHNLDEIQQDGWHLSNIYCDNEDNESVGLTFDEGDDNSGYTVFAEPGQTIHCFIGNFRNAVQTLTKTNNRPNPTVDGDTVTYTLTVTVPEDSGAIFNDVVTDLPPANFIVDNSSWTASSNVSGHDVTADVTEGGGPNYGSPGVWHIGTLLPGEIVTLTYKALINNNVSNGTYPDLAFVKGTSAPGGGSSVFGNVQFSSTPFVGTQVSVLAPVTPGNFTAGTVLGAEVLVNTGTSLLAAQFILPALLIGGVILVRRSATQGKGNK